MSIEFVTGDLFHAKTQAIVNTVNCVGVMGKGVALEFKKRWPENFKTYKNKCDQDEIQIGKMFVFDNNGSLFENSSDFEYLINFPTKKHWRSKSKIEYIIEGLEDFVLEVKRLNIKSVAIPPLGCGNGGLQWGQVMPLIVDKVSELPNVQWVIYQPKEKISEPEHENIPQEMTIPRAAMVKVLGDFASYFGGSYTRLSIQKLVYFMQALEVNFNLEFSKENYGPYSKELHFALKTMEKQHYLAGYEANEEITVKSAAYAAADQYLEKNTKYLISTFTKLSHLVEGFESPFGMELLSSVHYLYSTDNCKTIGELTTGIRNWNLEKCEKFDREKISAAAARLNEDGLIELN